MDRLSGEGVPADRPAESAGTFKYVEVLKTRRKPFHSHPEVELLLVLEGNGSRMIGNSLEPFQAGDLYLIGSDLQHTWFTDAAGKAPVRTLVIQFLPGPLLQSLSAFAEFNGMRTLRTRAEKGQTVLGRTRKDISRTMLRIGEFPPASPQRLSLFLSILAELCESWELTSLSEPEAFPMRQGKMNEKLNIICRIIQANLTSPLTQASVAARAGMSPASFSRFFKHYLGKRYTDFINAARVDLVCRALLETDRDVSEIALDFGFPNISHFNKIFKVLKGVAPSAYRRQARDN